MTYRLKEKLAVAKIMHGQPITMGFDKDVVVTGDLLENLLSKAELDGLEAAGIIETVVNVEPSRIIPPALGA